MLYAGLVLSRKCLDFEVLAESGERMLAGAVPPDVDGLRGLAARVAGLGEAVLAAVESMNGARFVHDQLELYGWRVEIADALKVKGLAPLACRTAKIDSHVLAELCRRDLVPAVWLPTPEVRGEWERARFRLHLVRQRVRLKSRIHATLLAFGHPCPVSDLFGVAGRKLLGRLELPEPWRSLGAEHRYVPLLMTIPGIAWILGYTIAAEIGEIERFSAPKHLVGYTGLCPKVIQSGSQDRRGPLVKNGPKYLRWAYVEAATHACCHDPYRPLYQRTKTRLGRNRGAKIATITVARKLAEASWWMLNKGEPFAPTGATRALAA